MFLFMEPKVTNAIEVNFFILKTTKELPLGDVAQEEMKFHYVVQCDFQSSFVWKRILLEPVMS